MKTEFCFTAPAPAIGTDPERKTRTFSGVANSGALVARGPFGRMGVDLEGARLLPRTPALLDHEPGDRVGFAALSYRDGVLYAEGTLLTNAKAQSIASDSDDGFPWQMSIYADPEAVESIPAGKAFTLNGREEVGPASVLRRPLIRELSFTPMGADHATPVQILSHEEALDVTTEIETALRAQLDDLTQKLSVVTQALTEATIALEAERTAKAEAMSLLQQERDTARKQEVLTLFTALGKTDADPTPYLSMSAEAWAAIKKDLSAFSARGNEYLFQETATGGVDTRQQQAELINQMASA